MQTTETIELPVSADAVFEHVSDLARYPGWLRLVHTVEPAAGSTAEHPAWLVELRAQIGPFARSKQLRMVRSECIPHERVVFERAELDGRQHANWTLRAELDESGVRSTRLSMHLAYDGRFWSGGLLERALDDEVRQGRARLLAIVSDATTH